MGPSEPSIASIPVIIFAVAVSSWDRLAPPFALQSSERKSNFFPFLYFILKNSTHKSSFSTSLFIPHPLGKGMSKHLNFSLSPSLSRKGVSFSLILFNLYHLILTLLDSFVDRGPILSLGHGWYFDKSPFLLPYSTLNVPFFLIIFFLLLSSTHVSSLSITLDLHEAGHFLFLISPLTSSLRTINWCCWSITTINTIILLSAAES